MGPHKPFHMATGLRLAVRSQAKRPVRKHREWHGWVRWKGMLVIVLDESLALDSEPTNCHHREPP